MMKILKFGGASVKDADGVKNFADVIKQIEFTKGVIVISAMGKMTNAFEEIVRAVVHQPDQVEEKVTITKVYHQEIINGLFGSQSVHTTEINDLYEVLWQIIRLNKSNPYDKLYDAVVSQAEIISTKICCLWLEHSGITYRWLDARKVIRTDDNYRKAKVDWELTQAAITKEVNASEVTITQGFIGSDANNNTTTLGREGSDYSAAIFAYCLDSNEVNIFKDVPGVMNADPRFFENPVLLNEISYTEAIEMSFYGASVIHPKTIQPLQKKRIPLRVKSFITPLLPGTVISKSLMLEPKTPIFIRKANQILVSISDKDFDFIAEENLSEIYDLFHRYKISINLMQLSAISFSVCFEDIFNTFPLLIDDLHKKYKVLYNKELTLYTIRHFTDQNVDDLLKDKVVMLKQASRETIQILTK
jgi:aspartate kinase